MIVLGISFTMDCGVVLAIDGRVVEAISEERLCRVKMIAGVPRQSIRYVLDKYGLTWRDIGAIATHGQLDDDQAHLDTFIRKAREITQSALDGERKQEVLVHLWRRYGKEKSVRDVRLPDILAELASFGPPLRIYPHHDCHAAYAYYASPFSDAFVLTADGYGEDASSTLWRARDGTMTKRKTTATVDSLGYFYGAITRHLGFTPHRHEGKVLGLAAHGDASRTGAILQTMIRYDGARRDFTALHAQGLYITDYKNPYLAEALAGFSTVDVAAGAQRVLEDCVLAYLEDQLDADLPLCVAGGIFANVRLNQKIVERTRATGLFVAPHMGDGGLAMGAVALYLKETGSETVALPRELYLGSVPSDAQIEEALRQSDIPFERYRDIENATGDLLADGKLVARFSGRMEYGPRALGNRSLLFNAADPLANDWLNRKLHRSEFMPFAPMTLKEHAADYYLDFERYMPNCSFMTVTVNCTERMRQSCPACVHVDGTARPQLLAEADNPGMHRALSRYHARTGIATVLNTSFNEHEHPIVETAQSAIASVMACGIPYLAIGPYLADNSARS